MGIMQMDSGTVAAYKVLHDTLGANIMATTTCGSVVLC